MFDNDWCMCIYIYIYNVHIPYTIYSHLPKRFVFVVFSLPKKGHMHKCQHFDGGLQLLGLSQQPQWNQWWDWAGASLRFPQQQKYVWVAIETKQTKQRTNLNKKHNPPPQFPVVEQSPEEIYLFHQPERDPQNSQDIPVKKTQIVSILYNVITCDRLFDAKVNGPSNRPPQKGAIEKPSFIAKSQQNISGIMDESTEMFRSSTLITFQ